MQYNVAFEVWNLILDLETVLHPPPSGNRADTMSLTTCYSDISLDNTNTEKRSKEADSRDTSSGLKKPFEAPHKSLVLLSSCVDTIKMMFHPIMSNTDKGNEIFSIFFNNCILLPTINKKQRLTEHAK